MTLSKTLSWLSCFAMQAQAETYNYTGQPFTSVTGPYTTSMRVTGSIVTSAPIPASQNNLDVNALLVSWTFSDGVETITSSSGSVTFPGLPG